MLVLLGGCAVVGCAVVGCAVVGCAVVGCAVRSCALEAAGAIAYGAGLRTKGPHSFVAVFLFTRHMLLRHSLH